MRVRCRQAYIDAGRPTNAGHRYQGQCYTLCEQSNRENHNANKIIAKLARIF